MLSRPQVCNAIGRLWRDQDKQARGAVWHGIVVQCPHSKTAVAEVNSQEKQPNNVAKKERTPTAPKSALEPLLRAMRMAGGARRWKREIWARALRFRDLGSYAGCRRVDESEECSISYSYANPPTRTSHAIFTPTLFCSAPSLLSSPLIKRFLDSCERQDSTGDGFCS